MSDIIDDTNLKKLLLDFVRDETLQGVSQQKRYEILIDRLQDNPAAFIELRSKMAEMGHEVDKMETFKTLVSN